MSDTTANIIDKIFYRNVQKMTACRESMHVPSINKAVSYLQNSSRIIFTCTGSSAVSAEEAVMRFTRTGKQCIFWRDQSLQLMTAATIPEDDTVIAISDSGQTASVAKVMRIAKENGANLIAINADPGNPVGKLGDVVLLSPPRLSKEMSALLWESTSSKSAQILIIDVLYACYATQNYDSTLDNLHKTYDALKQTRHS